MKKLILLITLVLVCCNIFSQDKPFLEDLSYYIENPTVFELGQEEARAYYIPKTSLSLNGSWQFRYSETPEGISSDFYKINFDATQWDNIPVPSNWEMQGYGDKFFRNVGTGYPLARMKRNWASAPEGEPLSPTPPPETPDEYNPTGAYRTSFELPSNWQGKEVFLRFEKVGCASFVWLNGKQVGFNEGSHEPAEYNITSYLKEGKNTLAVLVTKFSDAYYLEGFDAWRLAGIFDDVCIFVTPQVRLFDWQVITDLDENYKDANLLLNVEVKSHQSAANGYKVNAILKKDGKKIATIESSRFDLNQKCKETIVLNKFIENPDLWTAETPSLYNLHIELLNKNNKVVDEIQTRMGFKETEIIGNTFYLNGVPIKVNGINSHMQHPKLGHAMDEETIRKDFEILKQFNFNSVRTSHYPPDHNYVELADEYGIYIVDEVNCESHATTYLSKSEDYTEMYKDRARKAVLRDRNHPSVLFWSAGNESGAGDNITEVIKLGKELDSSRYWMYGGNAATHPAEDIVGPRYPTPIELEMNVGINTFDSRPSFMDEYLAVTGNAGGGLDEYWRTIYSHPRLMGGAIWDFVSPGITEPIRRIEDESGNNTPAHIMGSAKLVKGKNGKGIDLNGHDQWVEIYRADNVEVTGDQLTLTLDVYPRSLISFGGYFITKGNNQFGLRQNGKETLDFYLYNGKKQTVSAPIPDNWENNWHNITAVYNGETMKIYIDGIEKASKEVSGDIENLPWPINIGRNAEKHGDSTDEYICDAIIDNVGAFAKALSPTSEYNKGKAGIWLSFEKEFNEGEFFSNGIGARTYGAIWPDRTPQPEMWQMKKVGQPLSFSLLSQDKGVVEIWNHSCFTNASHWETTWTLTEDGKVLKSGKLDIDVKPLCRGIITIPYSQPEIVPGKEYRINISSKLKEKELWGPKGFEISWEQFELQDWYKRPSLPTTSAVAQLTDTDKEYVVNGEHFIYRFNKGTGQLVSMEVNGKEFLKSPLKFNVWRAPLANELDMWSVSSFSNSMWKDVYGTRIATEYYSHGIDNLKSFPMEIRATNANRDICIFVREQVVLNGGDAKYEQLDKYISGIKYNGFENIYEYTITGDGVITIKHFVKPQGTLPQFFPRMGLTLMLNDEYSNVEWYGRGPEENYPDRKSGYKIGIYKSTVQNMYEPYLIPQDYGLRTDNRWLKMTDNNGNGLKFSMDEFFNYNCYDYTTDNLTKALYTYQLKRIDGVTLNLDYNTTGVGGTARGMLNSYRVYPYAYSRKIRIEPKI